MASSVWIDTFYGISNNGTDIIFTKPGAFPDGTGAAPSITFASALDRGFLYSSGGFDVSLDGGARFRFDRGLNTYGFTLAAASTIEWGSSGLGTPDLYIRRSATKAITFDADGASANLNSFNIRSTALTINGSSGVASFGPSIVTSITVVNGIITAIS